METRIKTLNIGGFILTSPEFTWAEPERIGGHKAPHYLFDLILSQKRKFKRGLDMGTGEGFLAFALSKVCKEVVGVDIGKRSLEFAEENKRLNNINNIEFKYSDLYSNVKGKFDIIVSNPPFVFCPDDKGARWFYGWAGKLGIEIELKIIEGFDKFLEKGGEAFLFLSSPVIYGNNILVKRLKKFVKERRYEIELQEVELFYIKELHDFYSSYNIDYFITYLAHIKNNSHPKLKIIKLNFFKRLAYKLYIKRMKKCSGTDILQQLKKIFWD
ncbi:MAG: methyltransferase [Nanoarchaeota archaeon]